MEEILRQVGRACRGSQERALREAQRQKKEEIRGCQEAQILIFNSRTVFTRGILDTTGDFFSDLW
jgi:hypothetical protein